MATRGEPDIEIHAFERVPPDALAAFAGVPSSIAANLGDGCRVLPHRISRLCGEGVIVGTALTASAPPGDVLATFAALSEARVGDVIILATGGGDRCAVIGDRAAGMAVNAGLGAFVTDGMARDLAGLRGIGLPVHAAGLSPKSPARNGPARVGCAVTIDDVTVGGGDLIVADDDGVAIIAAASIEAALARLPHALEQDAILAQPVQAGAGYPPWLEPMLARARRFPPVG